MGIRKSETGKGGESRKLISNPNLFLLLNLFIYLFITVYYK